MHKKFNAANRLQYIFDFFVCLLTLPSKTSLKFLIFPHANSLEENSGKTMVVWFKKMCNRKIQKSGKKPKRTKEITVSMVGVSVDAENTP